MAYRTLSECDVANLWIAPSFAVRRFSFIQAYFQPLILSSELPCASLNPCRNRIAPWTFTVGVRGADAEPILLTRDQLSNHAALPQTDIGARPSVSRGGVGAIFNAKRAATQRTPPRQAHFAFVGRRHGAQKSRRGRLAHGRRLGRFQVQPRRAHLRRIESDLDLNPQADVGDLLPGS